MIYIPDVHGRQFWKDAVKKRKDGELVVFLGDYMEPYSHEGITHEDSYNTFLEILEYKKENPDTTVLLLGNHDFACIDREMISCRHDYENHERNQKLFLDNLDLFDITHRTEINGVTYLASHAGFHKEWLETFKLITGLQFNDEDAPEYLNKMLHENYKLILSGLGIISRYRGGYEHYGSCIWADVREYARKPSSMIYDNTFQIFGHTQLIDEPVIECDFACIDCRAAFRLNEEGKLEKL